MLSRAWSGVPSLGVGPVGVGVGVAVGVGAVVVDVVVELGAAVVVEVVGAVVDGLVTGGPAVEQAPSRASAAIAASPGNRCMNDGNPAASRQVVGAQRDG
jgi:hypothetical protein